MELYRVDYTILGLTSRKCMKLLPSTGLKFTQKVVVGDQEGITQIFFIKRGEVQVTFKSLPTGPISNIVLGGSIGTPQDKVFASSENIVRGFTKKGKMFLNFETQLLEPIKCMYICGNDLIVSGLHNYHHYHDCKLIDSYTCSDVINDIITLNVAKVRRLTAILACADHILRVLDGSTVTQSLVLPNSPTALHLMNGDGGTTGDHVLVGMQEGQIYLVQITRSNSTIIKWILENEMHKSEITCITSFDLMKTGIPDIIIGRHDGNIEVYTMIQSDEVTNEFKPPVEKFSYSCNESITSVQGGYVGNINFEEILITTYTGWLFGLTTEVPEKQLTNNINDLNYGFSREEKQKILRLKSEIEKLELKISKEREKYLTFTQEDSSGISRLPYLTINDKIILQKDDATYTVMLESETNIDNVLIQCDIPIKLIDVDKNSAVISYSKCDPDSENAILATYRCQLNTVRLELKFFVDEGKKGTLQTYVTPLTQPKCCQVRQYSIKPLSLHCRVHISENDRSHHDFAKFHNILQLKGTFSVAEIHTWVTYCLPELPEKPPDEEKITYTFKSTLINTILECTYSRGEAEFKSDNISTISILKNILSKEATKKKIKLDIFSTTNEQSITTTLLSLNTQLEKYYKLQQQVEMLEALKDIDSAQPEPFQNSLIPEYKEIIDNEKEILTQLKKKPFHLERLQNTVLNLFVDWHKFKGINIKPKLAAFTNTLKNNYNYKDIYSYFSL